MGKVRYEVTHRPASGQFERLVEYMRHHLFEVIATGSFDSATLERGDSVVRLVWITDSERLSKFQIENAPAMRKAIQRAFPGGMTSERQIFEILESWSAD